MKTNIKYSIIKIVFWCIAFAISLIGFIVLFIDVEKNHSELWVIISYGAFAFISLMMILYSIKNIEWFSIADGYLTVYCPFGIVKHVQVAKIKKAFKINAAVYSIKMLAVRRPHIVLCFSQSIKEEPMDAYNRNKKQYIIVPYTPETESLICSEYKRVCGEDLMIK